MKKTVIASALSLSLLSGCGDEVEKTKVEKAIVASPDVLVNVEGNPISALDLDLAVERTTGSAGIFQIDEKARGKILESLVMSKALGLTKENELSEQELASLNRQVAAYRDELLAKKYLQENITPEPVTEAMVEAYYQNNQDQYGAQVQKRYEILRAKGNISSAERTRIMAQLNLAASRDKETHDWQALARLLEAKKLPVAYSAGAFVQGTMAAEFERVINPLSEGDVSKVFFMRKAPAVVRVTEVVTSKPKPLAQVRSGIRKQLAPVQLRKAIKKAAEEVMAKMEIQYQTSVGEQNQ
ncbi:peptidylprolyl isomerase [uncultured Microbulbifer sp.]|uniref:peptidylprolyl isomerase n=1 Tax=uncultured Microbulbifer sp. TaxID=348147 RepID=UPI002607AEC1|nr:peptidylprolyl isomerase [uncultured Microbulbifer sp.]